MALGIAIQKRNTSSASRRRIVRFTTDAAYAAGGYAVTPAQLELGDIDIVDVGISSGGFLMTYDSAAAKLKCFKVGAAGPLTECANNEAGLNGQVFTALIEGDQINAG